MKRFDRKNGLEFVRRSHMFSQLTPQGFDRVADGIRFIGLDRGETLFYQDDPATRFYLVIEGWMKIFRLTPGGDEAVIGIFTRGQTFAEIAALARDTYPANAVSVSDTQLAEIPLDHLRAAISKDPQFALAMLASVSRHVRSLVDEIEQIKVTSGMQRVVRFLIQLSTVDEGSSLIRLPYEKTLIAQKLGMKAESLSRVFQRLRPYGLTIRNEAAIIDDIARLRQLVEGYELEKKDRSGS